jgi:hypothetical protein
MSRMCPKIPPFQSVTRLIPRWGGLFIPLKLSVRRVISPTRRTTHPSPSEYRDLFVKCDACRAGYTIADFRATTRARSCSISPVVALLRGYYGTVRRCAALRQIRCTFRSRQLLHCSQVGSSVASSIVLPHHAGVRMRNIVGRRGAWSACAHLLAAGVRADAAPSLDRNRRRRLSEVLGGCCEALVRVIPICGGCCAVLLSCCGTIVTVMESRLLFGTCSDGEGFQIHKYCRSWYNGNVLRLNSFSCIITSIRQQESQIMRHMV